MSAHLSDGRLDLMCDQAGCAAIFHGFNRHADDTEAALEQRVRKHAASFGWRRFRRHGSWHDACPECVRAWVRAGARRAPSDTMDDFDQGTLI